jgi:hypothetical protein
MEGHSMNPREKGRQDALIARATDRETYRAPAGFEGEYGTGWQDGCNQYDTEQADFAVLNTTERRVSDLEREVRTLRATVASLERAVGQLSSQHV